MLLCPTGEWPQRAQQRPSLRGELVVDRAELGALSSALDETMALEPTQGVGQHARGQRLRVREPADPFLANIDLGEQVGELPFTEGEGRENCDGPLAAEHRQRFVHALPVGHVPVIHISVLTTINFSPVPATGEPVTSRRHIRPDG